MQCHNTQSIYLPNPSAWARSNFYEVKHILIQSFFFLQSYHTKVKSLVCPTIYP